MEKMRQWSVLTALGVVGVLAAGWFLLVSPQHAHAKDLRTQAQSVQSATAGIEAQVQQLKAQQKGIAAQQRTLMKIATQIPNNPALPALIRQLSSAAHDAGVTLDSLAPAQPALVTPSAATAAASPLAQIQVTVSVTGSYFNIESFFRNVEHLDRAMMTTAFTLAQASGAAAPTGTSTAGGSSSTPAAAAPGALTGQITAVVFMSPDAAAAATTTAPLTPTTTASSSAPAATPAQ